MKYKVTISRVVYETRDFEVEVADASHESRLQAQQKAKELAANTHFDNPGAVEYLVENIHELKT